MIQFESIALEKIIQIWYGSQLYKYTSMIRDTNIEIRKYYSRNDYTNTQVLFEKLLYKYASIIRATITQLREYEMRGNDTYTKVYHKRQLYKY